MLFFSVLVTFDTLLCPVFIFRWSFQLGGGLRFIEFLLCHRSSHINCLSPRGNPTSNHELLQALHRCTIVHLLHSREPITSPQRSQLLPPGMLHPLWEKKTAVRTPQLLKSQCGPRVCDNRVCDGNAGPFGPAKPGVSTSAHRLINNWQRQTNQNNLLPAAKC